MPIFAPDRKYRQIKNKCVLMFLYLFFKDKNIASLIKENLNLKSFKIFEILLKVFNNDPKQLKTLDTVL